MVKVGLWKKDTALFCCASESLWRIAQRHGKSEGVEEFGELIPPNSTRRTWTWNPQTIVRWVLKLQSKQVHSNVISSTPDLLDLFDYGWILLDWLDGSLLTHGYAICPCTHHTTSTTLSFNEFLKVPLTSSADHTCEEMLFGWVRCCGFCAKVHSPLPLLVEPNPNLDFHILARCGLACWHCFPRKYEIALLHTSSDRSLPLGILSAWKLTALLSCFWKFYLASSSYLAYFLTIYLTIFCQNQSKLTTSIF